MRAITLVGLVLLAAPGAALAVPAPACTLVSDRAGDVVATGGLAVADDHLDLRDTAVRTTRTGLEVTIHDTRLAEQRRGVWRAEFTTRGTRLYVAAGLGVWANVGTTGTTSGFRAGVVGHTARAVGGAFDYSTSTVTVSVPFSAFGTALSSRRASLADVTVSATETFANVSPDGAPAAQATLADTATRSGTFDLGRC
jgi:hypothetical protein